MDIAQKKQAEIEICLKDALDLQAEVKEIVRLASQVSQKYVEIGNILQESSNAVGKVAKEIAKVTKFKNSSDAAGMIAEGAVLVAAEGLKKLGQWNADRKEKKALEILLVKKQELANAKKEGIIRLLPRIEKNVNSIVGFCKYEASTIIDFKDTRRFELASGGVETIFQTYFISKQSELLCNYLLDEFDAWINGEHESKSTMKKAGSIYRKCVNDLVSWSQLPQTTSLINLPNELTIGGYLLLVHPRISKYAFSNKTIALLENAIADKVISLDDKPKDSPVNSEVNVIAEFYSEHLKNSETLSNLIAEKREIIAEEKRESLRKKKRNITWIIVSVIVSAILVYFFY